MIEIIRVKTVLGEQIEAQVSGWVGHWNYRLWSARRGSLTANRWSTNKAQAIELARELLMNYAMGVGR